MPQPVKLSDPLINAAREASELAHRSLAAQVEHWATLGRAIEGQLTTNDSTVLKRSVMPGSSVETTDPSLNARIGAALRYALSDEAREKIAAELAALPYPIYGSHSEFPGKLVRRDPDGTLTAGRIVNREFIPDSGDQTPIPL